ncbi:MAG: DUF5985 family protein [Bdellovibrionota bacterium]
MTTVAIFLSGIAFATFAASGVFFLKFWKASKDPFFLFFCTACWLLALERITGLLLDSVFHVISIGTEAASLIYLFRLAAFALILSAVIQRNRAQRS